MSIPASGNIPCYHTTAMTCPQCGHVSEQSLSLIRKDLLMVCPECSHSFSKNNSKSYTLKTIDDRATV
ncbi:YnfU family zinc-binding protein [Serratia proteamaculans]|uniref:YnfU family zinc-binding protein n=1 Tax=Serratia proteamaculans TaxID=28151 RepID=UPI0028F6F653|nr:YnfU family zinc-binding protein [Serratia proteamaculans]